MNVTKRLLTGLVALALTANAQCPTYLTALPLENSGGTGAGHFAFVYGSATGYSTVYALVGSSGSGTTSCFIGYDVANGLVYLANDSGAAWLPAIRYNQSTPQFQNNSQCEISTAGTSAVFTSDSTFRLNLNISWLFGAGSAQMQVLQVVFDKQGSNSGWKATGVWNPR